MTVPTIYNETLAVADQEYDVTLPANTLRYDIQCRDAQVVRFAFETGKVATPTEPYATLKAGSSFASDHLPQRIAVVDAGIVLYFASSTAGAVVEVIAHPRT